MSLEKAPVPSCDGNVLFSSILPIDMGKWLAGNDSELVFAGHVSGLTPFPADVISRLDLVQFVMHVRIFFPDGV
jgi:hypothetical protein